MVVAKLWNFREVLSLEQEDWRGDNHAIDQQFSEECDSHYFLKNIEDQSQVTFFLPQ